MIRKTPDYKRESRGNVEGRRNQRDERGKIKKIRFKAKVLKLKYLHPNSEMISSH